MKRVEPYRTAAEAAEALDNGGRFFNILTKADDGVISTAEVGKVGGIFNHHQQLVLFLDMTLCGLDESAKTNLLNRLDDRLREHYDKYRAQELLPSEAAARGGLASNAVLTGIPKHIEKRSDFNGFIMMPIMAGTVMTFMMIPIIDNYDVYELRDEERSETFLIAHAKGPEKLPEKRIRVGGVIKELKADKEEREASKTFLEAVYYTEAV